MPNGDHVPWGSRHWGKVNDQLTSLLSEHLGASERFVQAPIVFLAGSAVADLITYHSSLVEAFGWEKTLHHVGELGPKLREAALASAANSQSYYEPESRRILVVTQKIIRPQMRFCPKPPELD
jgi:hypothetical protein